MSQQTKKLIMSTFIELLNERSFEKITVTDIVTRCDINRNTFYYYYQDIYDLLEELLSTEADRVFREHKKYEKWQDAFYVATGFARLNKKAINHIYKSMDRDIFEEYLHKILDKPISDYINLQSEGIQCSNEDKEALLTFLSNSVISTLVAWIRDGMKRELNDYINRISILFEGMIKFCLNNRIEYNKLKSKNEN